MKKKRKGTEPGQSFSEHDQKSQVCGSGGFPFPSAIKTVYALEEVHHYIARHTKASEGEPGLQANSRVNTRERRDEGGSVAHRSSA